MKRLLVTGGAGFIGSAYVRAALRDGWADQLVVLDKLTYAGNLTNLAEVQAHPGYRFVQGDIADAALVQRLLADGVDAVINFAAETHVDRSILEAADFVQTDVVGTWVLTEAIRAAGVPRFVHISTDEVYGALERGAATEDYPLDPTSPYAAAKAGGELLVRAAAKTFRLPALVVRGANAYGPHQYPEKLIPLHVTNALDDLPLPMYGDGQQRRQWTHVEDFVAGVQTVLERGEVGQVYNVGSPEPDEHLPTNRSVSEAILRTLGKPASLLQPVADRPAHDRRYRVDPSRLLGLGWTPRWTFARGLEATIAWYQEHPDWWRPLKDGAYRAYYEQNYASRGAAGAAPERVA